MIDYKIEYIPLKNLSVLWVKSQRPYNPEWAKRIGENFDPDLLEPLIVTKPNGVGMYHIIDGQHRKGGAEFFLKDPNQRVPCRVISEADPARAAAIFLGINEGRRAIRPTAAFLVAVEAKRELEVNINNIVRKAGYHVSDNRAADNAVSAVGALRKVYHYGPDILAYTLDACRLLWGNDSRGVAGQIISGLGLFLNEFQRYLDVEHFRKSVTSKYRSPGNFIEAVRLESEKSFESMDLAMSELIRMTYNKGRPENKKLKRKEA